MLKAVSGNTIFLGITRKNVERLLENKPIKIEGKDIGLGEKTIYIFYGDDEIKLAQSLGVPVPPDFQPKG